MDLCTKKHTKTNNYTSTNVKNMLKSQISRKNEFGIYTIINNDFLLTLKPSEPLPKLIYRVIEKKNTPKNLVKITN